MPLLTPRFHAALAYASMLHQNQYRKARLGSSTQPLPYVVHLLRTCAIVLENDGSETEAIAALLHDAVEDQGGEPQAVRIGELFGADVERIVRGCTDSFADTQRGEPKAPYAVRKLGYIMRLRDEAEDVAFVSAADKLDNARATQRDLAEQGEDVWRIFSASKARTIAYYRALLAVYRTKGARLGRIVDELDAIVERIGAGVPDADFATLVSAG
jgi:(p)ppGpp synthase/HD superfamily hydrolase